ncbi:MAG: hypothetical protein WC234_02685 [Endomicrobiaceae bacterium]
MQKNIYGYENINIQYQCNVIVNIPKNFINMCVKVSQEMNSFNAVNDNFVNIKAKKNNNFSENEFALMANFSKFKIIKAFYDRIFDNIGLSYGTNIYYLLMIILIFYIIGYIGLLRLFNDSLYYHRFFGKPLKLCLQFIRQSFLLEIK